MQRIIFVYIIVTTLFLSDSLCAQTTQGRIVTSDNKPLEYVTVKLFRDSTMLQHTLSDKEGMFTFKDLPAKTAYLLKCSFTGYEDVDTVFVAGSSTALLISMKQKVSELKEVVINTKKPLIERKVDRLVFNVQNSMASISGDALDVLKVTPLVMAENGNLGIIGKGSVAVMVNDKMLRIGGDDLAAYLRSIPSNAIESIEVITMPPSKYSAEGNSGILNIKLKKVINDYWSASIRSVYTQATYPTENLGIGFNYQKRKLSLSSNASMTEGSGAFTERPRILYATQNWESESKRRSYTKLYNARLQADYKISEKLTVGAQAFYNNSRPHTVDNTSTSIEQKTTKYIDSLLIGNGSQHSETDNVSLNLNGTYSLGKDDQRIVVDLDYYKSGFDNSRDFNSDTYGPDRQPMAGREWFSRNIGNNAFSNLSLNVDVEHKIQQFDVNYGVNYSGSRNTNELSATAVAAKTDTLFDYKDKFKFTENTGALFLTVGRALGSKFELQGGLRLENTHTEGISNTLESTYKNNYLKLFPTFYSSYKINDHHVLSLAYGRRIDRPAYMSLNPFERYITRYYYSVGNPYLLPSFSHNIELNYSNNDNLNLQAYTNFGDDQVAQMAIPHENSKVVVDTTQNFYNMFTVGLTAIYTFRKVSWLETNFILTGYYRSIRQRDTAIVPNYEVYVGYFSMDNNFKISKKISAQLAFFCYSPQINGIFHRTPRYNVNIAFRYKINNQWEAGIQASDILKTTQGKLNAVVNGVTQYYDNYYDTRNLRVTISYRFGSSKVNPNQRNFSNEKEKQRAY
ncbi:TonB-dependent receptor [Chitinophaga sp. G-6-1-13]|uniref:TonB-dependent receptor n=1 Tax=Chitinophaga fulva TaxID=2728842 RepID=A0A848GPU6_9BACT|nr:outer membrane beta-barrel family protein [Chitinophaga fulva]NML39997.1 TonB-dependent receptor [Chitinophaga fulva]